MSKHKILRLPFYCDIEDEDDFYWFNDRMVSSFEKMAPVFNRYGMYLDRLNSVAWVETMFGCWKLPDFKEFHHQLDYVANDEYILPKKVVAALNVLRNYRMLSKVLRSKLYKHECAIMLRETYRNARKFVLAMKKEV